MQFPNSSPVFADPTVGAVSGELVLETNMRASPSDALGIYWKIEKCVRRLESESGSVVGVTGAIYAIRRDLYTEIPPGTILDDVFVPMKCGAPGQASDLRAPGHCARPDFQ